MSLNDRLGRLERTLEHFTAHHRPPANAHVRPPCMEQLSDDELCDLVATDEQRQFMVGIRAMDATIPFVESQT